MGSQAGGVATPLLIFRAGGDEHVDERDATWKGEEELPRISLMLLVAGLLLVAVIGGE